MKSRHKERRVTKPLTLREKRARIISRAVGKVDLKGTHDRQNRQDWAESRKGAGWSGRLVDDAIGAASLSKVRAVADGRDDQPECRCRFDHASTPPKRVYTCRWCRALAALPVIDAGRPVECVLPRQSERVEAKV